MSFFILHIFISQNTDMFKKLLPFILLLTFHFLQSQNEFTTIWKPPTAPNMDFTVVAPYQVGANQIWFPGVGQNYTISWEEVGYPQHNGTMPNVTSTTQILIDFGTALNPLPNDVKYRVKVSNGNGSFNQIKFGLMYPSTASYQFPMFQNLGSIERILEVEQWGNIQWTSMYSAFANCEHLKITATDLPNFNNVTDVSYMFYKIPNLVAHASMGNWNMSTIKNFQAMFGGSSGDLITDTFNAPIYSWNISSAENLSHMFEGRFAFNQNINNWNTTNVKNMSYMFAGCEAFNQPLNNWNTSNVTNMSNMFQSSNFNQPINSWNTSKVTDISSMFHDADYFNQPLVSWNTNKLENMNSAFVGADSFDQSLGSWDLSSLTNATLAISGTAMSCINYSNTLTGWALNPNTANNISLGPLLMLSYSPDVITDRNTLISKGWQIFGDTLGTCVTKEGLGTSETVSLKSSVYPNPAHHIIYLKNMSAATNFIITDLSSRIMMKDIVKEDFINIQNLTSGTYILQIITKEKTESFKFIKK